MDYLRADDFADPDGSDQTAGLNQLLARARTTRRPVYFPGSLTFHHEGTLDARDTTNLIIDGGSGPSSENNAIPNLVFTGTGGPALDLGSAQGTTVRQLRWEYSSPEFYGDLIQTGHSSAKADPGHLTFDRCWFAGRQGVSESARSLVNLNRAIWVDLRSCYFRYSERAIIGRDPDYSNVVKITRCSFSRQGKPPISNPGEAWSVDTCGFEPLLDDTAGAVEECDPDRFAVGFSYMSNWHGDISEPGGSWLRGRFLGAAIQGNFFGTALDGGSAIELLAGSLGVSIAGNRSDCDWFITALPGQGGPIRGISVNGNSARSPANDFDTKRGDFQRSMIFANEAPSPDIKVTGSQTTGDALSSLLSGLAAGATIIDDTTS